MPATSGATSTAGPVHLSDDMIDELLDLATVTDVVGAAFAAWGRGEAATTQRVRSQASGAMASAMAAVAPPYSGGKVYATHNGVFTFVNVLFDMDGQLLCTLAGDALTRLRTPAACALAVRRLACAEPRTAALIGAGRQGWQHLRMLAAELPLLEQVRIYDVVSAAAEAMAVRAADAGIPAVVAADAPGAVDGADVVVTVTQSTEALFGADVVGDRTLLCAVGATKYDRCEIGADVIERCGAVICDDVAGSMVECGDLIRAAAAGRFDWSRAIGLHELLAGVATTEPAGERPVLFETQGVALQDVAAAGLAWERYRARHDRAGHRTGQETGHPERGQKERVP